MSDLTEKLANALSSIKDGVVNQYQQGAPYRAMLAGALRGDATPAKDWLAKQNPNVDVNDAVNLALQFSPMGLGTIGKVASKLTPFEQNHLIAQKNAVEMLGLPANNTAMDRARAMGFDDKTYYHGTNADIKAFDPNMSAQGGITWIADTPKYANDYTMNASQGAGNIIPLKAKMGETAGWKEYDQLGLDELSGRGYQSAWLPESNAESVGFVMNPNQLRSVNAAFDPAKRNSSDILGFADPSLLAGVAGTTGAGLFGLNYMNSKK